jgi:hypothetical protein
VYELNDVMETETVTAESLLRQPTSVTVVFVLFIRIVNNLGKSLINFVQNFILTRLTSRVNRTFYVL